ncbi:YggS family pyridoxal phosphate enzyme [Clostridia bacterium]|nr:YggS family pyridoxal phosphate enzyme [Clostridia bacterium]
MAVTKTVPVEKINYAIEHCGIDLIGENKANELLEKFDSIDTCKAEIHFIGSLQTNKVRQIIDKVSMIQSVNSLRLAEEIDKRASLIGKVMDILVEVNIGGEDTKTGINPETVYTLIEEIATMKNVRIRGLMTIPPISEISVLTEYFKKMYGMFLDLSTKKSDNVIIDFLSMGMSGDYREAIICGSNIVRIGTAIFGRRAI